MNFFYERCRPPHPRLSPYTPEVETPAPAHPEQRHTTGSSADHARHNTHARMPDTLHRSALNTRPPTRADRTGGGCWGGAGSVSETEQICTHSNMNNFQHKNVCKTIDINTRTCYYIDNTRTCYTTTKTGGQKP